MLTLQRRASPALITTMAMSNVLTLQRRATLVLMTTLCRSRTQANCLKTAIKIKCCYKVTSDSARNPQKETYL